MHPITISTAAFAAMTVALATNKATPTWLTTAMTATLIASIIATEKQHTR